MYSPLTTKPRSTVPWRIQLLSTMTPDSIPAQALDRSNVIALVAPIASATAALMVGSSHCVRPSRYFVMLQLITTSSDDAGWSDRLRQSCAAAMARVYESSSPIDTRRSWIPVSRSRSMCVRWRVDAIRSSVVRWVLGRRRPTLASRARYGDRTASGEVSSISQCLTICASFPLQQPCWRRDRGARVEGLSARADLRLCRRCRNRCEGQAMDTEHPTVRIPPAVRPPLGTVVAALAGRAP